MKIYLRYLNQNASKGNQAQSQNKNMNEKNTVNFPFYSASIMSLMHNNQKKTSST